MMTAVNMEDKTAAAVMGTAPVAVRGAGQPPAVLSLRWRQVASAAEKRAAEATSAMAEAEVVMVVASAAAGLARWCIMAASHAGTTATIITKMLFGSVAASVGAM